jgi:hypothetical protein
VGVGEDRFVVVDVDNSLGDRRSGGDFPLLVFQDFLRGDAGKAASHAIRQPKTFVDTSVQEWQFFKLRPGQRFGWIRHRFYQLLTKFLRDVRVVDDIKGSYRKRPRRGHQTSANDILSLLHQTCRRLFLRREITMKELMEEGRMVDILVVFVLVVSNVLNLLRQKLYGRACQR